MENGTGITAGGKIYCYGDSNTYGFDPRSYIGGRYSEGSRWVERLKMAGFPVINGGMNGRKIPYEPSDYKQIEDMLERYQPESMLIMLGINDVLQYDCCSIEELKERMNQFLKWLGYSYPGLHLILTAPPATKVQVGQIDQITSLIPGCYRDLSTVYNTSFVDASAWNIPLAYDGVHFTETGHWLFADNMAEALKVIYHSAQNIC